AQPAPAPLAPPGPDPAQPAVAPAPVARPGPDPAPAPAIPRHRPVVVPDESYATRKAPPETSSGPLSLDAVLVAWPSVVRVISQDPPTKPLIEACAPVGLDDGILSLGFPESRAFLRERAERKRAVIEDGLRTVLGREVHVRCVATNVLPEPLPPGDEAERLLSEARRIFADDLPDVPEVR
ncbi:MAG: hypothetical protein WCH74_14605, partial [Chloroflexota bacterium]